MILDVLWHGGGETREHIRRRQDRRPVRGHRNLRLRLLPRRHPNPPRRRVEQTHRTSHRRRPRRLHRPRHRTAHHSNRHQNLRTCPTHGKQLRTDPPKAAKNSLMGARRSTCALRTEELPKDQTQRPARLPSYATYPTRQHFGQMEHEKEMKEPTRNTFPWTTPL